MLRAERLTTPRLVLEPLRPEDAAALAPALDDPALHAFIGGVPSTEEQLRERYARLVAGQSPDGAEDWLNWVVRDRATGDPVDTLQATVRDEGRHAELAWVIVMSRQEQGLATEAATAARDALRAAGVDTSHRPHPSRPRGLRSRRRRLGMRRRAAARTARCAGRRAPRAGAAVRGQGNEGDEPVRSRRRSRAPPALGRLCANRAPFVTPRPDRPGGGIG